MYVCLYVYMYVYMYVCMYVCMYACMHACMHVCILTGRLQVTSLICSSIFFPDCSSSSYESFSLFFNSVASNVASRGEDSSIMTSSVSVDNIIWLCVVLCVLQHILI